MAKSLDEQIEERQQQAIDRKIFEKAIPVADALGKVDSEASKTTEWESTSVHVFNSAASSLQVRYERWEDKDEDYGGILEDVTITSGGRKVFKADNSGIDLYIPGSWEKQLDALQTEPRVVKNKEDFAAKKTKEAKQAEAELAAIRKQGEAIMEKMRQAEATPEAKKRKAAEEAAKREKWAIL